MTAVSANFWADLEKGLADKISHSNAIARATEVVWQKTEKYTQPKILTAPNPLRNDPKPQPAQMPIATQEWSGVLNIINGARLHAEAQKTQLREQAKAFEEVIQEMREDASLIREQIGVLEAQVQKAKAKSERQLEQTKAQAEKEVRDIQAKADIKISEAHRSNQCAAERASVAEDWLKRIEEAAKNLALEIGTSSRQLVA